MINHSQLLDAVKCVENDKGTRLAEELAESLAYKVQDFYSSGESFGQALRLSLNHCRIFDREKRQLYGAIMGKYFGAHGGRKTARLKAPKLRVPARVKVKALAPSVSLAPRSVRQQKPVKVVLQGRQLAWLI